MKARLRPPGPPQRFFTGSFSDFRTDLLGFMQRLAADYGDVAYFRLGRRPCVLVNHPDLIDQVLVKNSRNFIKPFPFRFARGVLGNGLLTSEGDFWLRQRRLAAPAFRADRIASYASDMVAATTQAIATWQPGQPRDVHADMMHLTLDVVARTLFGADVTDQSQNIGTSLLLALRAFGATFNRTIPLPGWVPTRGNRRARAAVRELNRIVRIIIDRRRHEAEHNDLLSMMIHARDEDDGSQMTDEQLADEARTFLLAGHETTAIALSWTWYLLAKHPQVQAELAAELDAVLAGCLPQAADLPRLKTAERIVLESMRLYPPVFMVGREPLTDIELGGYAIPAGTTIFTSQWVTHRDARFYERPESFEPDRWSEERSRSLPKMAYFPFGGGPRVCIGNTFAMMEAVLLLTTIAQQWQVRLVEDQKIRLAPLMTLRPRYGIQIVPERRAGGARPGVQPRVETIPLG